MHQLISKYRRLDIVGKATILSAIFAFISLAIALFQQSEKPELAGDTKLFNPQPVNQEHNENKSIESSEIKSVNIHSNNIINQVSGDHNQVIDNRVGAIYINNNTNNLALPVEKKTVIISHQEPEADNHTQGSLSSSNVQYNYNENANISQNNPQDTIKADMQDFESAYIGSSKYEFRNRSQSEITVIMDNCREIHTMSSGGTQIFVEANIGDQPTFRVVLDKVKSDACTTELMNRSIAAKKVDLQNAISASGIMEWDGKEIR